MASLEVHFIRGGPKLSQDCDVYEANVGNGYCDRLVGPVAPGTSVERN